MPYQTFLISDMKTGKFIQKEPWLAPQDAWPTLLNAYLDGGVLKKRPGFTELADTGAGNPIMGIAASMYKGQNTILVCDTKRTYKLNITAGTLTDLATADTFEGTDKHFFWFQNWRNKTYFCNFHDPIYTWDEGTETFEILDTGDVDIETCMMMFKRNNRLIFVSPQVDGVWYPDRIYYTDVNSENVSTGNWVDGQTGDVPVTGGYIRGEPYIFMRNSIYRIAYTRDTDTPFKWEIQSEDYGSLTRFACGRFGDRLVTIDHNHVITWDGYRAQPFDSPITGIVDIIEATKMWYAVATALKDKPFMYLAYPNDGSSLNDRILQYNIDEKNWAIHNIAAHCLFAFDGVMAPPFADADAVYDSDGALISAMDFSPSQMLRHSARALTFAGTSAGKILRLHDGTDDNGSDIEVNIRSAQLNRWTKEGFKAKLGYIKVLVTTDSNASYTVSFYKDMSSTPYKTGTLDCSGNGDKHWETVYADGEVGNFHELQFSHTEKANAPEIHGVLLAMKQAGRLSA